MNIKGGPTFRYKFEQEIICKERFYSNTYYYETSLQTSIGRLARNNANEDHIAHSTRNATH